MTTLDDAYANGAYIPGSDAFPARWQADAAAFRREMTNRGQAELGVAYGGGARQSFDLFWPAESDPDGKGVAIFVHGGYWMKFDKSYWSHFAAGPLRAGFAVAMPSYDLCPDVRISAITRQIADAVRVISQRVSGPIRLAGHSAGGHLVARMAEKGVLPNDVHARLAKVLPISPLTDLHPLMQTSMNETLGIDDEEALAESPALHERSAVPVTVWVGADERPAFIEQARALEAAWQAQCVIETGKHHFDVIDGLRDVSSPLCRALLEDR